MIDTEKIKSLTKWLKEHPDWCWNYPEQFAAPFMEAVGDDRKGVEEYLGKMKPEELATISGVFEDLYGKWTDNRMWRFLEKLQKKITDAGLQP